MDKGSRIELWKGEEQPLWDGMRLVRIGGHFPGSSILQAGNSILTGDTVALSPSKKFLAVMYSYPNRIPLPLQEIRRIEKRFETLDFDNLYGFWSYQNIRGGAKELLMHSLKRYI